MSGRVSRGEIALLAAGLIVGEANRDVFDEAAVEQEGARLREFKGEGDRQYLTGLKLGGERTLAEALVPNRSMASLAAAATWGWLAMPR